MGGWVGGCASQDTFSSFYYFKHRDQFFIFKCTNLKVVYHITLIVLVIGKAQFRRAMLSCDSSCSYPCYLSFWSYARFVSKPYPWGLKLVQLIGDDE